MTQNCLCGICVKTGAIEYCGKGKASIKCVMYVESPNSQTTGQCIHYSRFKWT